MNVRKHVVVRLAAALVISIGTLGSLNAWRHPIPDYRPSQHEWKTSQDVLHIATLNRFMMDARRKQVIAEFEKRCGTSLSEAGYASIDVTAGPARNLLTRDLRTGRFHIAQVQSSVFIDLLLGSDGGDMAYEPVAQYAPYNAVVLTRRESPIYDLVDLNGRQVGCVSEASLSGYRVPMAYLRSVGITPKPIFSSGSDHKDVVRAVLNGEVGAAFTHNGFRTRLPAEDLNALREITIPSPIPASVWVVRSDIAANESLRGRIIATVMHLAASDDDPYWSVLKQVDAKVVSDYTAFQMMLQSDIRGALQ